MPISTGTAILTARRILGPDATDLRVALAASILVEAVRQEERGLQQKRPDHLRLVKKWRGR